MTIIELMVTVVIVGVLSVVAAVSLRRSAIRTKMSSEINLVFAAFKSKLDAYKLENSTYVTTNAPATDDAFFPTPITTDAQSWADTLPASHQWRDMSFTPGVVSIYCQYVAFTSTTAYNPGSTSGTAWPGTASKGAIIFGTANVPSEAWYYIRAKCNLDNTQPIEWNTRFDNSQVWMVEE